jgi:hypothetical protein
MDERKALMAAAHAAMTLIAAIEDHESTAAREDGEQVAAIAAAGEGAEAALSTHVTKFMPSWPRRLTCPDTPHSSGPLPGPQGQR